MPPGSSPEACTIARITPSHSRTRTPSFSPISPTPRRCGLRRHTQARTFGTAEQQPFLELISERKVNATLKQMGRPAGDHLTPEVAREVCRRTGSKAMLTGSIASLGSQYVVGLTCLHEYLCRPYGTHIISHLP